MGSSTFSRGKEFRNFLPFPLSPDPTKAERAFYGPFTQNRQGRQQWRGDQAVGSCNLGTDCPSIAVGHFDCSSTSHCFGGRTNSELLRDPTEVLLPSAEWPQPVPQAKVWVASDNDWADICKGCARRGLFTFLRPRDVFSSVGTPVLNGMFGMPKKGKLVEGTNLPIVRLILNAIPSNPLQRIIEADIRALPYHGQWSGSEVVGDDRVIVWSESDMTAAFYCFLLEPSWYPFQAINKTVRGSLAAEFDSTLGKEPRVYPSLRVMPMAGRASRTGPQQENTARLAIATYNGPKPARLLHRLPRRRQPELVHISELASAAEVLSATAAVHDNWGIPRQLAKEVLKEDEIEVLGARVAGTLGRISLPRAVASKLIALSSWFCQEERRAGFELSNFAGTSQLFWPMFGNGPVLKNCGLAAGFSQSL